MQHKQNNNNKGRYLFIVRQTKKAIRMAEQLLFTPDQIYRVLTLTIEKIIHRTPVDVDDALIADMGIDGVNTGEEYRNNVRMQMFRDLLMLIGHINRIIEQKAGEVCGSS